MATPTKKKAAERDKRTERVYKKPTKPPQRRRATKDEPRPRAEAKNRPTRETPAVKKRAAVAERDKRTERVFKKPVKRPAVPPPTEKVTPRPEGGPTPMIRPGVGPVAQLSSQAAHTFGYTPEAYAELTKIPTKLGPPENEWESQIAASYRPGDDENIRIVTYPGYEHSVVEALAHEQAHGWWDRREFENPAIKPEYQRQFNQWTAQPGPVETFEDGSTGVGQNAATIARRDMDNAITQTGLYPDPAAHPTELYARTVQFSPNSNRQDWPDTVRPYYAGFLQGMDTLSTGEPTVRPEHPIYGTPDSNGIYGSPAVRRWR
jgi:hypothetical protein